MARTLLTPSCACGSKGGKNAFTDKLDQLHNEGFGGGDACEDVAGALLKAVDECKWSGDAKFLLLLTDHPAHGPLFNTSTAPMYDASPELETRSKQAFQQAFSRASAKDVRILHCTCDPQVSLCSYITRR